MRRVHRTDEERPVVVRNRHVTPHLPEEQGREALSLGLELQQRAAALDPHHAHDAARRRRRIRWFRRLAVLLAFCLLVGAAVIGRQQEWWPTPFG